jgi:hypothetical protein
MRFIMTSRSGIAVVTALLVSGSMLAGAHAADGAENYYQHAEHFFSAMSANRTS